MAYKFGGKKKTLTRSKKKQAGAFKDDWLSCVLQVVMKMKQIEINKAVSLSNFSWLPDLCL